MKDIIFKEEAYAIIGACLEVHNVLGPGFAEAVYHESLSIEFEERGIPYQSESPIVIRYKGRPLKKRYSADFLCYEEIIVEIKAVETLTSDHEAQLLNYLKGTEKPLGILVNFGAAKLQHHRFANTRF
jgi:GxxExxY protein